MAYPGEQQKEGTYAHVTLETFFLFSNFLFLILCNKRFDLICRWQRWKRSFQLPRRRLRKCQSSLKGFHSIIRVPRSQRTWTPWTHRLPWTLLLVILGGLITRISSTCFNRITFLLPSGSYSTPINPSNDHRRRWFRMWACR